MTFKLLLIISINLASLANAKESTAQKEKTTDRTPAQLVEIIGAFSNGAKVERLQGKTASTMYQIIDEKNSIVCYGIVLNGTTVSCVSTR